MGSLIERLRARRQVMPAQGGGGISGNSYVTDDGFRNINPDGPEAADELSALREKVAGLKGALQNIADGWPFPVAEARRALLDLQGGEDAH